MGTPAAGVAAFALQVIEVSLPAAWALDETVTTGRAR